MNTTEIPGMQALTPAELADVDGGVLHIALAVLALELHIWCMMVCEH